MIALRVLCLFLLVGAATSVGRAQFEQLIQAPETDPNYVPEAAVLPPAPRLLPPTLHRTPITQLDQSPDNDHLLTADDRVLRVWDVAHRAAFAEYQSPKNSSIGYAAFTNQPRQLFILSRDTLTSDKLRLFDNFDFSKPSAEIWLGSFANFAFHRDSNAFIRASVDANRGMFEFSVLDVTTKVQSPLRKIDLRPAYGDDAKFSVHQGNNLSLDATGRFAAFRLAHKLPMAVLDLAQLRVVTTVPPALDPVGMLPSGEILLLHYTGGLNRLDALNPATGEIRLLGEITHPARVEPTLPHHPTDPIVLRSGPHCYLHDLATGRTSREILFPDRTTDVAITLRDGPRHRPLVAQSASSHFNAETVSTFLELIDPLTGIARGTWSPPSFAANELFPRSDDFEFVVRRGTDLRRVRFTESALQIEPLTAPTPQKFTASAIFERTSSSWQLIGAGPPALASPADSAGAYTSAFVGATSQGHVRFNHTFISDRSRDGRILALHHGNGVQVIDTTTGRALCVFANPDANTSFKPNDLPGLALSPDGTAVVFSYSIGHGVSTECHDTTTGALKWKASPISRDFKYSSDGTHIYGRATSANATIGIVYAHTGELASTTKQTVLSPDRFAYNATGSLVALTAGKYTVTATLDLYTLPEGKRIARVELPAHPTSLGFIGSDRFILANSATDEVIRLIDIQAAEIVAEVYLFESPQKWLVRHPATHLFASETSLQDDLQFAVGEQITPLASYFDEFYRPRLLGSLIKGLSPRPSVPVSDLRYAPKLTLSVDGPSTRGLTVEDEFESLEIPTPEVTLKLDATCEGSPIADLRIYHNGKLVAGATRGLFVEDDEDAPPSETFTKTATHTFTLTPGKNRFRAVAINQQGTESVPDELMVYSDASPPVDDTAGIALHVITVGINAYQNPAYNLNYARADAQAVEAVLRTRFGSLFTRANHYALYDAEATRENILATLDTVKREAGPRDVFVFYYAGHGIMSDDDDPEFYLAPFEITQLYGERRIMRQLGIPGRELLAYSRDIAAQKQLFILDACQSAGALKNVAVRGAVEERAIAQLARSTGTHWLTATGSEQFATEFQKLGHGAFTKVLLDALDGAADTGDGIVSVNELKAYIEAKVPELTAAAKGEAQYPVTYGYGQDFPLTVLQP